jgi:hypothetical protein
MSGAGHGHTIPQGRVTRYADGRATVSSAQGQYQIARNGSVTAFSGRAGRATFLADGRPHVILKNNLAITHDTQGGLRIASFQRDGSRLVNTPAGGFLERRVNRNGQTYAQRTYVVNGRSYTRSYGVYRVNNIEVMRYIPPVSFAPAFLLWAAAPRWGAVPYDWGWSSQAWFVAGGGYFVPAGVYTSPALWVTDYAMAASLRSGYPQGTTVTPALAEGPQAPISPALKSQFAAQVQEHERSLASTPQIVTVADKGATLGLETPFIVSDSLDVMVGDQECSLTAGDIVAINGHFSNSDSQVPVVVKSSKARDCAAGSRSSLSVGALEEMHAAFLDHVDAGLGALSEKQGSLLPQGPPANPRLTGGSAAPEAGVADRLGQQMFNASRAEREVLRAAFPGDNP